MESKPAVETKLPYNPLRPPDVPDLIIKFGRLVLMHDKLASIRVTGKFNEVMELKSQIGCLRRDARLALWFEAAYEQGLLERP